MRDASSYPEVSGPAGEVHAFYSKEGHAAATTSHPIACYSATLQGREHGENNCGDVRVTRTIFIGRCSTFDHGAATVASFKYFMFAG